MQHIRYCRRAFLLALTLVSACAAAEATPAGSQSASGRRAAKVVATGAFGEYLAGRFAIGQSDPEYAADQFLRALAANPGNLEIAQQTFLACLMSGRPEAVRLAKELPDSQAAQLLLGDVEARAGNWDSAEQRFHSLPRQGMTQLLQPLLVAWAQQGGGHTDAALGTLRPYVEGQRFRAVYALHAAMIADLAGRTGDAARLYRIAQAEYGGMNLRLAQVLASWQARQGHPAEAQQTLRALADAAEEMSIAVPAMTASLAARPVSRATDGIAEAYLALAAALRQQDSSEFSLMLLRLALNLRPDLTPARLLLAEVEESNGDPGRALRTLAAVGATDPLIAVVRLRRAKSRRPAWQYRGCGTGTRRDRARLPGQPAAARPGRRHAPGEKPLSRCCCGL